MARKHVISPSLRSSPRRVHRVVLLGLFLLSLYASNTFVMPSILGHSVKSRMSLHVSGEDVTETTSGVVGTRKKFEEFKVGDEVDAVIIRKNRFGIFCGINAEKPVMLSAPRKLGMRLKFYEKVKASIEKIDLEKRQGSIVIPDLEELVQDRKATKEKSKLDSETKPQAVEKPQAVKKEKAIDPEVIEALKVMEAGQALSGKVVGKSRMGIWFDIGSTVRPRLLSSTFASKLRIGEEVKLKVVDIDVAKGRCDVDVEDIETFVAGRPEQKEASTLEVGSVHVGRMCRLRNRQVMVDIDCVKKGWVNDGKLSKPHPSYQEGQEVEVKVVQVDPEKETFCLEVVSE